MAFHSSSIRRRLGPSFTKKVPLFEYEGKLERLRKKVFCSIKRNEERLAFEEGEDDEPPGLEAVDAPAGEATPQHPKQSRAERKVRKAMAKLGMKPVSGIMRVTVKRGKNALYVISRPEVFKSANSDSYVAFGEIGIEDLSASQERLDNARKAGEKAAAEAAETATTDAAATEAPSEPAGEEKKEEEKPAEPEEVVDETGLNKEDIDLIVKQAKCTRAKAVEGLRKNNGDIVNTIMELSQ